MNSFDRMSQQMEKEHKRVSCLTWVLFPVIVAIGVGSLAFIAWVIVVLLQFFGVI